MRQNFTETIEIPEGVTCTFTDMRLTCSRAGVSVSRAFAAPGTSLRVEGSSIVLACPRANRRTIAFIKTARAHVANMIAGLESPYVYELEICNVHFPMTTKVEGNRLVITNFLGEKEKRVAAILPSVHVDIKGQKVTVSSADLEAAGQTAANIEKATHIPKRDRRVFQDGIFITSKCGRNI